MNRFFFHTPARTPSATTMYRQLLPQKFFPELITAKPDITSDDIASHSHFVFSNLLLTDMINVLSLLKNKGKKLAFALDDDVWNIPSWNPASKIYDATALGIVAKTLDMVDEVVVSTEPLAQEVGRHTNKPIHILPNLIDLEVWPEVEREEKDEVRILWAGSVHHREDLWLIVEPLEQVLTKFKNVRVLFFGDMPEEMGEYIRIQYSHLGTLVPKASYGGRLGFISPVSLSDYPATMRIIQPDIALCPLADVTFNDSKSNIKWLECSLSGAAVLASDLPPYRCISSHLDGMIVGAAPCYPDWYTAIETLVQDVRVARLWAARARQRIEKEYSWQGKGKDVWRTFLERK